MAAICVCLVPVLVLKSVEMGLEYFWNLKRIN